jgi:Zn-finger nucleic acid-binding protein
MPLSGYEASPGVQVELCTHCRGIFLDRHEIKELVGRGSLKKATEVVPVTLGDDLGMRCPKCVNPVMQPLRVIGADSESWQCRSCGGLWLAEGAFFALAKALRTTTTAEAAARAMTSLAAPGYGPVDDGPRLAHSRIRFDRGLENVIVVPVLLAISWFLCSGPLGRLFASMVGMPFHELGHAAASWISSRIAVPLPFFTIWYDDQSWLMGSVVAAVLGWFAFHTYREKNRFMFGVTCVMTVGWLIATFLISPATTLMWQIMAGGLGEIFFGSFILIAFHFPLPDRFRWDFWRYLAVIPGSICFAQALTLWRKASKDLSQMPWGSAIGAESDGDMNRLVNHFGWNATELAEFYLGAAYVALAALVAAYAYAAYRLRFSR